MRSKATLAVAGALLMAGCVGPGGRSVPPAPAARPVATRPVPTTLPSRPLAVRQPVASVPLPAFAATVAPGATSAAMAGLTPAVDLTTVPLDPAQAGAALAAFRISCPSLVRRTDTSGMTIGSDWQAACTEATRTDPSAATAFFQRWFEAVQVGDGRAYATGYYIP